MVTDTSLLSYFELQSDGSLGEQQRAVYTAIKALGSASNNEVSRYLGLPINCVTPRVYELRKAGLVVPTQKRPCTITGRAVIAWSVRWNQ